MDARVCKYEWVREYIHTCKYTQVELYNFVILHRIGLHAWSLLSLYGFLPGEESLLYSDRARLLEWNVMSRKSLNYHLHSLSPWVSEWVSEWTHYFMLKSVSYISLLLLSVLIFSPPSGYWVERERELERDHSIGHELNETHTVWEKVCVLEERLMTIQLEPLRTLGQTGSFIMIAKKTIPVYSSLHLSGKNKT